MTQSRIAKKQFSLRLDQEGGAAAPTSSLSFNFLEETFALLHKGVPPVTIAGGGGRAREEGGREEEGGGMEGGREEGGAAALIDH